jgi:anti-sigma factor RsiW
MECRAAVDLMTDYIETALDDRLRRRFESHLASCPACTAYLDQMRMTIAVLGRLDIRRFDPDVRAELVAIYRAFRAG